MGQTSPKTPRLIDILRPVSVIDPGLLVREAILLFNKSQGLMALPVIEDSCLIGLVRKSHFFRILSRPYALELFSRLPIRELLEEKPFSMGVQEDIHQALVLLLQVDPTLETDCFPVVEEGECLGIVAVSDLMMSISHDQVRLLTRLEELSSRIREEVAKAACIQHALLPPPDFRFPGVELAAALVNSTEVGGDYYDFFVVDSHRLGLLIADVSGHGVQAGMVTTAAKASLNTLVGQGVTTPAALLAAMNEAILAAARQYLLMTCLVAVIDCERGQIRFANAGHNFPYLHRHRHNSLEMLQDAIGFPLGFDAGITYQECTVSFEPGDTFICHSDGINECCNGTEEFGYNRLEECIIGLAQRPPVEMVAGVLSGIRTYSGLERFEDDVTMVVARCMSTIPETENPVPEKTHELDTYNPGIFSRSGRPRNLVSSPGSTPCTVTSDDR